MKRIFLALLAVSCLGVKAQDKVKQIDSLFTSLHNQGRLNGNVLIAEKGNVIYKKSFGLRDEANKLPLDENSVFELASVSKQFTAMGIVISQEKGKLKYEDKLSKFFPELGFYGDITVRQLLNHTSGLPDYMDLMEANWDRTKIATNKDIIAQLVQYKPELLFVPGARYEYSNTGYALLASIIEKASGTTFADFLKKNIFVPLKMDNSFVYNRRLAPRDIKNYAYGYVPDDNGKMTLPDNLMNYNMVIALDGIVGDGNVNSTVIDLLKWDRALYTDKLVSKKSIEAIFTPPTDIVSNYGFGWEVEKLKDFGKIIVHNGSWPGYITHIERHIDSDKTIIILRNNSIPGVQIGTVRKLLYNIPLKIKRQEIKLTEQEMLAFVGEYSLAEGIAMQITYDNGLKAQLPGQPKFDVFAENKTKFFFKVTDAQIEFFRDEKGTVTKMVLYQRDRETDAPKIK